MHFISRAMNPRNALFVCIVSNICCVVLTFNLATTGETVQLILSSVAKLREERNESDFSTNLRPSYFGYTFQFTEINGTTRLIIGAPKTINPCDDSFQDPKISNLSAQHSTGSIQECKATASSNINYSCKPAYPPNSERGDNFGLEVAVRPDGSSLACSPIRGFECGGVKNNPGFCYKSADFGQTWNVTENTKAHECSSPKVEVLFVLDGSYSIEKDFSRVKEWVKNTTRSLGLEENGLRVGVVQYSSYIPQRDINSQSWIVTHIKIGKYQTYNSFAREVDNIRLFGKETYTGRALEKAKSDLQSTEYFNNTQTKQIMILLTDGKATDTELVSENAAKLRAIGVTSFAVGVGEVNTSELRTIANGNPEDDTRVLTIKNFDMLDAIAKELKAEIGIILEGQGNKNDTSLRMQFAELGLAVTYSEQRPERGRRDRTPPPGVRVTGCRSCG